MEEEIPKVVLEKHPEMVEVFEAIRLFKSGKKITTSCRYCDELLTVDELPNVGVLNVSCSCGKTSYRSKWDTKKV
jgi:hypothetical protein